MNTWGKVILLLVLIMAPAVSAQADLALKAKVDALFVIASSGELKFRDLVGPAEDSIAALGVDGEPYLIARLGTTDARERVALENIFKKIGRAAAPLLNQALRETDSLQLSRVALMLNFLPETSSVSGLLAVINHPFYWVRYEAVRALGSIGDRRAVGPIREALGDGDELVRTVAAVAAGKLNDSTLAPDLAAALDDSYYGVRMAAAEEIKKLACSVRQRVLLPLTAGLLPRMARISALAIMADDSCVYPWSLPAFGLNDSDPAVVAYALKAAFKAAPDSVMVRIKAMPMPVESVFLRQTMEELAGAYEKKTTVHP